MSACTSWRGRSTGVRERVALASARAHAHCSAAAALAVRSAPHREVECLQERRATLKCYEGLKGVETLVCDPFVTAYTECAERTLQQFVRVK